MTRTVEAKLSSTEVNELFNCFGSWFNSSIILFNMNQYILLWRRVFLLFIRNVLLDAYIQLPWNICNQINANNVLIGNPMWEPNQTGDFICPTYALFTWDSISRFVFQPTHARVAYQIEMSNGSEWVFLPEYVWRKQTIGMHRTVRQPREGTKEKMLFISIRLWRINIAESGHGVSLQRKLLIYYHNYYGQLFTGNWIFLPSKQNLKKRKRTWFLREDSDN